MKPGVIDNSVLRFITMLRTVMCVSWLFLFPGLKAASPLPASPTTPGAELKQHYDQAQQLQSQGKLPEAAEEYREFLAQALGELADAYMKAPDYATAAPLFDEALSLRPASSSLLLDYAQSAIASGDLPHAKTLAARLIGQHISDKETLAVAHQILGRVLLKADRDQDARKELEAAVALDPTFANGYDLAVACLDLNDEMCATQLFGEMQKSFGDHAEIHMSFGRAFAASDFQSRAVTEFERAIEENPHLPKAHSLLAAVLLSTGSDDSQLTRAEAQLKTELAISPQDASTYAALGRIAVTRAKFDQAETYLEKAVMLAPRDPDAYLILGQLYFNTEQYAKAEAALSKCVELTTDPSRNRYQVQKAHYLLGRILSKQGQTDVADAEMRKSRELANQQLTRDKKQLQGMTDTPSPNESEPLQAATGTSSPEAHLINQQALSAAETIKAKLSMAIADGFDNLGAITATSGDYAVAADYFKKASVWNPTLDGLDYNWGRAAFAGAKYGEAILPLSRYVHAHSDDPGARGVLAVSQFMNDDFKGCIETLQPLVERGILVAQVDYAYAESLVRTGQVETGFERLSALEKSNPEMPEVHRALGEVLLRRGDPEQAQRELRLAVRLNPSDAESHYELGAIALDAGSPAKAIPELETAVQLSPKRESFHRKLADGYAAARRTADAQREIETSDRLREQRTSGQSTQEVASP